MILFVDTETTGLDPKRHEVWEIAYALDTGATIAFQVHHSLRNADPFALRINDYFDRVESVNHVKEAFLLDMLLIKQSEIVLCAANPTFDSNMLEARWGRTYWSHRMIDIQTFAMAAMKRPVPVSMKEVAEFCEVEVRPDHTAFNDVRALQQSYYRLAEIYGI